MLKSVEEVATELGVSKTAIYNSRLLSYQERSTYRPGRI